MYKMLQLVIFDKRLTVLIFITLTLSVSQQSNQIDCQLIGDLTTSSKLFSDLSTGGSIFRHILSYVESGRNFLSSTTSLSDHSESTELITTLSPATTTESIVKPVLTESSTVVPEKKDNPEYGIKQISETPIINSFKTPLIDTLKQKVPSSSFRPFSFNLFKRDPVKEELQLRLEYIKMKILHKLGLNRAPSIRPKMDHEAYSQILELRQLHSDPNKNQASRQDYYDMDETDESDKLFLLPIKSGSSSATFNMTLDIDIKRYPFRKVTLFTKMSNSESNDKTISLMLTKKRSDSTTNSSYDDHFERIKPINDGASNPLRYTDNTLNDEYEWREYDLSQLILKYKWNQLEGQPMIVIETLTSSAKLHSSLMTIEFNYISASRRRRKVDCNATKNTSSCCRESFYVNFTQIGWDNWIVQPPGYYANYCKGKCDISHARYHHTTVVQKYSSIINLCCSPREMSNISLIYVNESGYLFQKNLANMVVESCDCA